MERLLSCDTSQLSKMNKKQRLEAIEASEGRIVIQELSFFEGMQLLKPVTDAEVACAFGADILLLNAFDVYHPNVPGIVAKPVEMIRELKKHTGRLIGINLEPVSAEAIIGSREELTEGRIASANTAKKAKELGFDFILLTGNPGTGVTNKKIMETLKEVNDAVGNELILMAGKMHAAGSKTEAGNNIITKDDITQFVNAGADVVLLPAPGTVPGIRIEYISDMITYIHTLGKLSLTAIGTSQEGASTNTIETIALNCKMTGTDLHHIGDAGVSGLDPENLMAYNIAIKGKRHTYLRMARSINR